MDKSNYNDVLSLAQSSEDHKKVKLILDYEEEVPDPYFGRQTDLTIVMTF